MKHEQTAHGITFTRVNNDINGNPRFVCHYLNLLSDGEIMYNLLNSYQLAIKKANRIGGRKFSNKQYGGGIVFQSYNLEETAAAIIEAREGRR